MQRGVPMWEAAGFLGMSAEILQDTYGHHHPDYLQGQQPPSAKTAATFRWLNWWLTLERRTDQKAKNLMITWSEWQDLNLRPLRPERSALPG